MPARVTVPATDDEIRALASRILEGADYAAWRPGRWLREWMRWLADLAEHSPVLYWVLVGGLAVVTLALSVQVFLAVRRTLREAGPRARVLPSPPPVSFAAEADALAGAGRFLEAAHRLQLAVIDLLLRGHVLELGRADANRTLRHRLRGAAIPAPERADLLRLIDRFERAWFRDRDDDPELYADWRTLHERLGGRREAGMRRGTWIAGAVLVGLLVLLGSLYGPDDEAPPASADTSPLGYRAALDLLAALHLPASRQRGVPDTLPADAAAWWIAPPVCGTGEGPPAWSGRSLVEAGGTAVILLPREDPRSPCRLAPDLPLPARDMLLPSGAVTITGDLIAGARQVSRDAGLLGFDPPGEGWTVRATVKDRPLVVERALGAGRLVVVADARLFRNARLDLRDTAPLLVDLVRDTGVPRVIDPSGPPWVERNALGYLARSPAVAAFAGLLLAGALLAWHGTLVPPRRLADGRMAPPTLDAFVDALAGLYARTGDWTRVAARYRELTASRLRRHFGLAPETSMDALVARLGRDARFRADALAPLVAPAPVADEPALRALAAQLDALVARAAS